jgi:hypothetical protein
VLLPRSRWPSSLFKRRPDRKRGRGRGCSRGRPPPRAAVRRDAPISPSGRRGSRPCGYPQRRAGPSRPRPRGSTTAARPSSSRRVRARTVVEALVALFVNRSHRAAIGSPGGVVVDLRSGSWGPDEDPQGVRSVLPSSPSQLWAAYHSSASSASFRRGRAYPSRKARSLGSRVRKVTAPHRAGSVGGSERVPNSPTVITIMIEPMYDSRSDRSSHGRLRH